MMRYDSSSDSSGFGFSSDDDDDGASQVGMMHVQKRGVAINVPPPQTMPGNKDATHNGNRKDATSLESSVESASESDDSSDAYEDESSEISSSEEEISSDDEMDDEMDDDIDDESDDESDDGSSRSSSSEEEEDLSDEADDESQPAKAQPQKGRSMRAKTRKKAAAAPDQHADRAASSPSSAQPNGAQQNGKKKPKKKRFKPKKQRMQPPKEEYTTDEDDDEGLDGDRLDDDDQEAFMDLASDEESFDASDNESGDDDDADDSDGDDGDDRESVFERGLNDEEDAAFRQIPLEAFRTPKVKTPRRRLPKTAAAVGSMLDSEHGPTQLPLSVDGSVEIDSVPPQKQKKPWQPGVDFFQDVPFCGRNRELQSLTKAVERVSLEWMENAHEIAWITGPEGVGKTALALETSDRVFDTVYCAYGAFEENTTGAKPFSGLTECLNDLVERMHEDGGMPIWKTRLEEALGGEGPFLSTVIPNLQHIMDLGDFQPHVNGNANGHGHGHPNGNSNAPGSINVGNPNSNEARRQLLLFDSNMPKRTERLGFAVRDFLSAIAEHYPIVMVIDNLQHADLDSLYMLQSLATEKSVQNLLIIGCFGGVHGLQTIGNSSVHSNINNANSSAFVPPALRKMQETIENTGVRTTHITLEPLSHDETEQLLSIALIEEGEDDNYDEKIEELAEILFAKCEGNPLFVLHLLRVLHDKELLVHSSQKKLWLWNCDKLEDFMDTAADTAVLLLKNKVQDMPKKMRLALTTAACAGMTHFQVSTLYREVAAAFSGANNANRDVRCPIANERELSNLLNIITSRGLLEYLSNGHFKFSHDSVRHAAFSLLPKGQKGKIIHFRIGSAVSSLSVQIKDAEEKGRLKFLAVDNLNRCSSGVVDEKQRMRLSKLNMEAAEAAIMKSAFYTAIQYLKTGISIVDPRIRWRRPLYELTLRMHLLLARTQYCCGQLPIAEATIHIVLKNAMCFKDKVGAYQCMILLKIEQQKFREALDLILFILFQLGEDVPTENVKKHISKEIDQIREYVRGKKNRELLQPPNMTDRKGIDSMAVLAQLAECAKYYPKAQRQYRTLATLKMMKLTLRNGYCRQTSFAYSLFASTLARFGIYKEAYRLGRIAERLATARPGCIYASQALAHYHWNVSHWGRSYIRNLAPLLKLYNDQIDVGDFQHAPFSIMAYVHTHLASGCDLEQLEHNLNLFQGVFQDYQLDEQWQVAIPQRMTLNLMGRRGDPDLLFGQSMEEQDAIVGEWEKEAEEGGGGPVSRRCQLFYFARMFIACIFNDMVTAHKMQKKLTDKPDGVWIPYRSFLECLMLLSRVKSSKDKKKKARLQDRADKILYKMTGWHNDGAVNCSVLVNFLEAELEILTAKERSALKMRKFWDEAIEDAKSEGMLHLEAWANERAGLYFVETEVPGWASTYLTRAYRAYQRWGCHAKLSLLEVQFPQYLKVNDRLSRRMSASDWRAKYDTTRKSAIERELDDLPEEEEDDDNKTQRSRRSSLFPVPKSPFSRSEHGGDKKKKKGSKSSRRISGLFTGRKQTDEAAPAYDSTSRLDSDSGGEDSPKTPKTPRRSFLGWKSPKPVVVEDVHSDEDDSDSDEVSKAKSTKSGKSNKRLSKLRLPGLSRRTSKKKHEKMDSESFTKEG